MRRDIYTRLVDARTIPVIGKLAYYLLKLLGVEIPVRARVGKDLLLLHGGVGVVIHSRAVIGDRVRIYPGVTVGRADVHVPIERSKFEGLEIGDDVILSSGAKVLCKEGVLHVGRGAIVAANAVLLESTGDNEIWGGIPAKRIGMRETAE